MHIRDIPPEWVTLLRDIRQIAPDAHIAGGALRDLDHGRPVKDIDLFIAAEHDVTVELRAMVLGFERDGSVDLSSMKGADPAVTTSVTWKKEGHLPVNAIYLKRAFRVEDNLHRLDLGLCQIAFDGQSVLKTMAYMHDKGTRSMTVCRCDSSEQMERTIKRAARLRGKYPDHGFRIPTAFRHL